jgi:hypothetical protein
MSDHDENDRKTDEQYLDRHTSEPSPSTGWRGVCHALDVPTPDAGGERR